MFGPGVKGRVTIKVLDDSSPSMMRLGHNKIINRFSSPPAPSQNLPPPQFYFFFSRCCRYFFPSPGFYEKPTGYRSVTFVSVRCGPIFMLAPRVSLCVCVYRTTPGNQSKLAGNLLSFSLFNIQRFNDSTWSLLS